MGKKVFVSYKYGDTNVAPLQEPLNEYMSPTKVRDYVTELQKIIGIEHVNKGEKEDESLEDFKHEYIRGKLSDKIFDSTVTIVLISPNMKDESKSESEQWIPWEISYSLKNKKRTDQNGNDQNSYMNAVLAVVLPDKRGGYNYFIKNNSCVGCGNSQTLMTQNIFEILSKNMFNIRHPTRTKKCSFCQKSYYKSPSSYIKSVTWSDFIKNVDVYITQALSIKSNHADYNIVKKLDA